jgi:hypothetical protein
VDFFSAPYKFRLYNWNFLYKTLQIFSWYESSEVKVKISPALVKPRRKMIDPINSTWQQQSIAIAMIAIAVATAAVFIAIVFIVTVSDSMLLLLCFSLLPLLPNFIVITDDCAVAAAVSFCCCHCAQFLLLSLPLLLYFYCHL